MEQAAAQEMYRLIAKKNLLEREIEADQRLMSRLKAHSMPEDLPTRLQCLERLLLDWSKHHVTAKQLLDEFEQYCERNSIAKATLTDDEETKGQEDAEPRVWEGFPRGKQLLRAVGLWRGSTAKTVTKYLIAPTLSSDMKPESPSDILLRIALNEKALTQTHQSLNLTTSGAALFALNGRCFDSLLGTTSYQVCPFQNVTQHQGSGETFTLGMWHGWKDHAADSLEMEYQRGSRCWQGPLREARVKLVCGVANQVLSVYEPSVCTYYLTFSTPAVCQSE